MAFKEDGTLRLTEWESGPSNRLPRPTAQPSWKPETVEPTQDLGQRGTDKSGRPAFFLEGPSAHAARGRSSRGDILAVGTGT